jgi:hypothetical protein
MPIEDRSFRPSDKRTMRIGASEAGCEWGFRHAEPPWLCPLASILGEDVFIQAIRLSNLPVKRVKAREPAQIDKAMD